MSSNLETHTMLDSTVLAEASTHLTTIRDFIRFAVTQMRANDVDLGQGTLDFFAESTALVMQTLSLDWSADAEILDAKLLPSEKAEILQLLKQRIETRTPLAYLLNLSYFCNQPFYVDERVLIPRSPIAELINCQFAPFFTSIDDLGADSFNHGLPPSTGIAYPERILDLCTGSGCIAIALAYAFDEALVDASDISDDALEVAAINVEHHQKDGQLALIKSDLFEKLPPQQQYDLIVSNPPYVDAADMAELPKEFSYEPEMALAAGQDGLDLVRKILANACNYLSPQGLLVVEVGNSEWALRQAYPKVDFYWLNFASGGTGIFALTAAQCKQYQSLFAQGLEY